MAVNVVAAGDDNPTAKLDYTWSFGPGRTFAYEADATAVKAGDDWHVQWSPEVLHPKLRPGMTFQFSDDKNFLTPVVDRDGQPLLSWQTIGVVNLARAHLASADALAAAVRQFDDTTTAASINDQFNATAGRHRHGDQAAGAGPGAGQGPTGTDSRRHGERAGCVAHRESRPVLARHRRPAGVVAEGDRRDRRLVGEPGRRQGRAHRGAGHDTARRHQADPHDARHPAATARPAGRRHRTPADGAGRDLPRHRRHSGGRAESGRQRAGTHRASPACTRRVRRSRPSPPPRRCRPDWPHPIRRRHARAESPSRTAPSPTRTSSTSARCPCHRRSRTPATRRWRRWPTSCPPTRFRTWRSCSGSASTTSSPASPR